MPLALCVLDRDADVGGGIAHDLMPPNLSDHRLDIAGDGGAVIDHLPLGLRHVGGFLRAHSQLPLRFDLRVARSRSFSISSEKSADRARMASRIESAVAAP